MEWWKTAVYASFVWVFVSVAIGVGMLRYITTHRKGHQVDVARAGKAGDTAGMMCGVGVGVIGLGLFARSAVQSRRPKKRRRSGRSRSSRKYG